MKKKLIDNSEKAENKDTHRLQKRRFANLAKIAGKRFQNESKESNENSKNNCSQIYGKPKQSTAHQ